MNSYAIIFDMDGVLVDSNPYHKIALNQFCADHGYHLTEEGLRNKIYGRTNKEWITNLFGTLTPEQLAQYGEEKEALYAKENFTDEVILESNPRGVDDTDEHVAGHFATIPEKEIKTDFQSA